MESLSAVLPITIIVIILCVTIAPLPPTDLLLFLTGAMFLIVGMGLFTLGAETAMMPIGEKVGGRIVKTGKLPAIIVFCFIIGVIVTIAEPDLQVLADQTPSVPSEVLILSVALGVGAFLVLAFLRILFGLSLSKILIFCYVPLFIIAFFVPKEFLPVAFDSGGVTTGPVTVPFIMALGLGLNSAARSKNADSDNFGFISLCSVGPIISVMLLGFLFDSGAGEYTPVSIPEINTTKELWLLFAREIPSYAKDVLTALLPIVVFFLIFRLFLLKIRKKQMMKIFIGLIYTFFGLTLFLTGVNVGFMPAGNLMGSVMAGFERSFIIIPTAMVIGYFIVKAEPAVHLLNEQVESVTEGVISEKVMMRGLSVGMAVSLGLSMVRVLTGISILWFLLPCYAIAIGLSFFVPKIFTSIAFDSGGVASGPMTATFLLPFAMGACEATGGNCATDAFGVIAMVAMTPLMIIQGIGLMFKIKTSRVRRVELLPEDEIIIFEEDGQCRR